MKRILIIGICRNPDHHDVQAVKALNHTDVAFFLMDKGQSSDKRSTWVPGKFATTLPSPNPATVFGRGRLPERVRGEMVTPPPRKTNRDKQQTFERMITQPNGHRRSRAFGLGGLALHDSTTQNLAAILASGRCA